MTKITENAIELFAIELLEKQGYNYIYAPNIAPDSDTPLRESFEDVILKEKLQNSLTAINPTLEYDQIEYAVKQIEQLKKTEPLTDNEAFHKMFTEGITVEVQKDGVTRGEIVKLIDFDDVSNNDFVVSNQFTIIENGINKRPDLILFVNGLPLVVVELKNPVDENATIGSAYKQIITATEVIEELINLSKDIHRMDEEPKEMGLTDFEYAFYSAIANNDSAKEVMGKEVLCELAVVLTERVRANASIDWTIKESVRSKLKVIVKRTLRQFGYPPDMQKLATETVLKQAEMIADELINNEKR